MIAIIKYNAGNIKSVENALLRLGYECIVTNKESEILRADKVIFPGVGEASSAMKYLKEKNLDQIIPQLEQPVLGICLGLQLMCKHSEEGNTNGLGIFDTKVKKFLPKEIVPHMGWNNSSQYKGELFQGINSNSDFFFVHSYYAERCEETIGVCDYILPFSSALQKNNFYAVQFHPEKSASVGAQLLKNFITL
jgi:glutamine amidotransferase